MIDVKVNSETIRDIELFVFDKDGTIIELYNYWYHMIELRAEGLCSFYSLPQEGHKHNLMSEMGIDLVNKRLKPEGPVGILPRNIVQKAAEDYLSKLDCQNISDSCFRIFKEVDNASLGLLDKFIKPIKGAVELLENIKKRKGKIAIATTDKTERAKIAIGFLQIKDLVDCIIGADMVKHSKPAPDMLKLIGKKINVSPGRSVMVGDAKTDIEMGINADFKASIAVCNGLTGRDELSRSTLYVIEDVSKLIIV